MGLVRRLNFANVIATIALFVALGGGAYAALSKNSVKSKQIAANAVKEAEIANAAVTARKLAPGVAASGAPGPAGAQGPEGPRGADGAPGASIFDATIPSGKRVTGLYILNDSTQVAGHSARQAISFPVPAPVALTDSTVGVGVGSAGGAAPTTAEIQAAVVNADEDAACTGNAGAPSAPAGRLCFYIGGLEITNVSAGSIISLPGTAGGTSAFERRSGAFMLVDSDVAGVVTVRGTWAYTAP